MTEALLPFHLSEATLKSVIHDYAAGALSSVSKVPGMTPQSVAASLQAYRGAFVDALRGVYIAAACFAAVAVGGKRFFLPIHGGEKTTADMI